MLSTLARTEQQISLLYQSVKRGEAVPERGLDSTGNVHSDVPSPSSPLPSPVLRGKTQGSFLSRREIAFCDVLLRVINSVILTYQYN